MMQSNICFNLINRLYSPGVLLSALKTSCVGRQAAVAL